MKLPSLGDLSKTAKQLMVVAPKVFGASAGLVLRPYSNWVSPLEGFINAIKGLFTGATTQYVVDNIQRGTSSGILSYTGVRTDTGKMDFQHALGAKAGIIGFIVSEVVEWIVD